MEIVLQIGGIPVHINIWLLFLGLLFWMSAFRYLDRHSPESTKEQRRKFAIIAAVVILLSLGLHEAGHAIVIKSLGYEVLEARVTSFGAYVLPSVNFADISASQEFVVGIAGPLANFLLTVVFVVPVWVLQESIHENTLQYAAVINFSLGWLNMLPIIGLDGSKVLHAIIWRATGNHDLSGSLIIPITLVTVVVVFLLRNRPTIFSRIENAIEAL